MKKIFFRTQGVTMVELLVATTISAVVLAGLFASLGSIYMSQKKINATNSFASESRFLMEQIAQLVRNNTIDYDQFFIEVGPSSDASDCQGFEAAQIPENLQDGEPSPEDLPSFDNNRENREAIGYKNIFYWNVAPAGQIARYRNLGGKSPVSGVVDADDSCAEAWPGEASLDTLYLINKERTEKTAIRLLDGRLQKQRLLGVDTVGDGEADRWGFATEWDAAGVLCNVFTDATLSVLMGSALGVIDEQTCARGHDWTNISPEAIEVVDFEFIPSPNRDPYLNYRIDVAQTQPNVFLRLHTKLRRPGDFGVKGDVPIELIQQTMASSRVFGDPR